MRSLSSTSFRRRADARLHAECLADDRARRHHHHGGAGGRDGPRLVHQPAGHHRRRARRRLEQGQAGVPDGVGRQEIRQSGIQLHLPDLGQRIGDRLLHVAAHCRRAGAPRAARCGRGEMGGAGRRAFDRAERRRAQGVGTAHRLWRDRRVRDRARRIAEDRRKRSQADGKLSPHRQGHRARRRAAESQRRGHIRHGRAGARHGLRRGAAIALCRAARRSTIDDSRARESARRHRHREIARRRRRHRHDGRRHASGQEPAQGDVGRRAGRASRQRASARGFRGHRPRQELAKA